MFMISFYRGEIRGNCSSILQLILQRREKVPKLMLLDHSYLDGNSID